jgi:hypothetical protein
MSLVIPVSSPRSFRRLLASAAVASAGLAAWPAHALDAPLAADSHLNVALPTTNFGGLPTLNVGGGATALLRFDLGTLPAGTTAAKLVRANLLLFVNRIGAAGQLEAQPVRSAWAEATVTAASPPVLGGLGSGVSFAVGAAGQFVSVDITPLVKDWISNPANNFGIALVPAVAATGTVAFFDSKENTATAHVARLDLTLADQGPQGLPGSKGDKGDPGQAGAQGLKGDKGDTGAVGAAGAKGDTGAAGAKGDTGAAGAAGAKGDTGATGAQGARGFTGAQGPQGVPGPVNLTYVRKTFDAQGKHIHDQNVQCPANTFLLGGGCGHRDFNTAASDIKVEYSGPHDDGPRIAWRCIVENTNSANRAVRMYAICSSASNVTGP